MNKTIATKGISLISKLGYHHYVVRYAIEDYTPVESDHKPAGEYVKVSKLHFNHQPTLQEIKEAIETSHNTDISKAIINGFTYNGKKVRLTIENQTNFAALHAVGQFPQSVKIGDDYEAFATKTIFTTFYKACREYIENTLAAGRAIKEAYDWQAYANALKEAN